MQDSVSHTLILLRVSHCHKSQSPWCLRLGLATGLPNLFTQTTVTAPNTNKHRVMPSRGLPHKNALYTNRYCTIPLPDFAMCSANTWATRYPVMPTSTTPSRERCAGCFRHGTKNVSRDMEADRPM